jgi:hypothetical protein
MSTADEILLRLADSAPGLRAAQLHIEREFLQPLIRRFIVWQWWRMSVVPYDPQRLLTYRAAAPASSIDQPRRDLCTPDA